jgi:hexosaminidase
VHLSPNFKITVIGGPAPTSTFLSAAVNEYDTILRRLPADPAATFGLLEVHVASSDVALSLGVDESYTLQTKTSKPFLITGQPTTTATLTANTVFGALRGLETFVQLVDANATLAGGPASIPAACLIEDSPRFQYRGLMMDTARHFYPVDTIKHTIGAMMASKLNVLHLHMTDDQSWPVESLSVPELALAGAFRVHGQAMVYSSADIKDLLAFAEARGVLIIAEFDMPAHSSSWAAAFPQDMITKANYTEGGGGGGGCSKRPFSHGDTFDPRVGKSTAYARIDSFLGDMIALFGLSGANSGRFLHLGGDEVPTACWASSPAVVEWMKAEGIAPGNWTAVEQRFVEKVAGGPAVGNVSLMYW